MLMSILRSSLVVVQCWGWGGGGVQAVWVLADVAAPRGLPELTPASSCTSSILSEAVVPGDSRGKGGHAQKHPKACLSGTY